jgi:hypothetical protein
MRLLLMAAFAGVWTSGFWHLDEAPEQLSDIAGSACGGRRCPLHGRQHAHVTSGDVVARTASL